MNYDTKSAWHDALNAITPYLDSVQYKIYTWIGGLSVGYQITSNKPDWVPDWLHPSIVWLSNFSWLETVTAWAAVMLAVERTFSALIRFNQWRRARQIRK